MKVIINGELIEQEHSEVTSSGWRSGIGIFETIKTVNGQPWAFSRHMRRAVTAALEEKIKMPGEENIRLAVSELIATEFHDRGVLRLSFDMSGNWAAAHIAYSEITSAAKVEIYPDVLINSGVPIKSYPYNHRLDILEKAKDRGFDEALVINADGNVCEGAVTNVLLKIAGKWSTPPLSDGVLPGVMRALVIENCDVGVRSISVAEIQNIEAGFLLSSLRIAQPISSIDGRVLAQSHDFKAQIEAMALRTSVG